MTYQQIDLFDQEPEAPAANPLAFRINKDDPSYDKYRTDDITPDRKCCHNCYYYLEKELACRALYCYGYPVKFAKETCEHFKYREENPTK